MSTEWRNQFTGFAHVAVCDPQPDFYILLTTSATQSSGATHISPRYMAPSSAQAPPRANIGVLQHEANSHKSTFVQGGEGCSGGLGGLDEILSTQEASHSNANNTVPSFIM